MMQSKKIVGLALALALSIVSPWASADTSVTVLYDAFGNDENFSRDWGFAALLSHDGYRILIDTGNDPSMFEQNIAAAEVDLANIDAVVLTHAHMDHLGGLPVVLDRQSGVRIFAPEQAFSVFGSRLSSSFYRQDESLPQHLRYFNGTPPKDMIFPGAWPSANVRTISESTEILPGIHLLFNKSASSGAAALHEISLAVETPNGLVVIVGCSHPGIANVVDSAKAVDEQIALVVGGFHMPTSPDDFVEQASQRLRALGVQAIAPAHCTGETAIALLRRQWGDRFVETGVGSVIGTPRPMKLQSQPKYEGKKQ